MLKLIADLILIGLSLFGWINQLLKLAKERSIGSFSIHLTAVIIICNIIKLSFWFIVPFATTIVIQSALVITINIAIIRQCLDIENQGGKQKRAFSLRNFWKWDTLGEYFFFMCGLAAIFALCIYATKTFELPLLEQIIGYLPTLIQISLPFPQMYQIYKRKSVQGVSMAMVGIWMVSDGFKTAYFILNEQPIQFIMTGVVQIFLDILLIMQFALYRQKNKQN